VAYPASYPVGTGVPFPGVKHGQGMTLTTHPNLVPRSRMSKSYTSFPPCYLHGGSGTALLYFMNSDWTHYVYKSLYLEVGGILVAAVTACVYCRAWTVLWWQLCAVCQTNCVEVHAIWWRNSGNIEPEGSALLMQDPNFLISILKYGRMYVKWNLLLSEHLSGHKQI
jgi:hypothetical protein